MVILIFSFVPYVAMLSQPSASVLRASPRRPIHALALLHHKNKLIPVYHFLNGSHVVCPARLFLFAVGTYKRRPDSRQRASPSLQARRREHLEHLAQPCSRNISLALSLCCRRNSSPHQLRELFSHFLIHSAFYFLATFTDASYALTNGLIPSISRSSLTFSSRSSLLTNASSPALFARYSINSRISFIMLPLLPSHKRRPLLKVLNLLSRFNCISNKSPTFASTPTLLR